MRINVEDELGKIHSRFIEGEIEEIKEKLEDILDEIVEHYSREDAEEILEEMDLLPEFKDMAFELLEDLEE